MRGGEWADGVLSTKVEIDGSDGTGKLVRMINQCKFKPQLQAVFLDGIALGGFNVIDIKKLNEKTKLPIIVVIRRKPDIEEIKKVLKKIKQGEKADLIEKAGQVVKIGKLFVQLAGLSVEEAREYLQIACTRSLLPEPIRLAHMIASGVVEGESKGRA